MPLIALEYTDNIDLPGSKVKVFLRSVHTVIAKTIDANIHSCKSSARVLTNYCVGDEQDDGVGFVVLKVQILSGRSYEARVILKDSLLAFLVGWFHSASNDNIGGPALRVLVTEIDKDFYAMAQ